MTEPALSSAMRMRVRIVVAGSVLLFLTMAPFAVLGIVRGKGAGAIVPALLLGVVIPLGFCLLTWWGVRRWKTDPERRRREPNRKAGRILLFGNLLTIAVAQLARSLAGSDSWQAWTVGLGVVLIGTYTSLAVAKRHDPRLHFFRRPDPAPEDPATQSDDRERSPAPW